MSNFVMFTPDMLERLKAATAEAVSKDKQEFEFQGVTLLVVYAKYLIEYLDEVLDQRTNEDD